MACLSLRRSAWHTTPGGWAGLSSRCDRLQRGCHCDSQRDSLGHESHHQASQDHLPGLSALGQWLRHQGALTKRSPPWGEGAVPHVPQSQPGTYTERAVVCDIGLTSE